MAELHKGWAALTFALLTLGVFAGGGVVGWWIASDRATELPEYTRAENAAEPAANAEVDEESSAAPEVTMPDLRGIPLTDARQVLADVGVAPDLIAVDNAPAAGPEGVVVAQDPVFGYDAVDGATLQVSVGTGVPDVVGQTAEEAVAQLQQLGAQVELAQRYEADAVAGAPIDVEPAPGTRLPEVVSLVIATAPAEVTLNELNAVDGFCYRRTRAIEGIDYEGSVTCRSRAGRDREYAWLLDRAVSDVSGVLGIPDTADTTTTATVEILADGISVRSYDLRYGEAQEFELDASGVLRLTLIITNTGGPRRGQVLLGAVTLSGDPALMESLGRGQ